MAMMSHPDTDRRLESPLSASQLDRVLHGDCLEVLRGLPDASVDAIVTDPPYGLGAAPDMLEVLRAWLAGEAYTPRGSGGFMGKAWDAFVPGPEYWRECLRVLKPGGHALVFAGTRTWDVMGLALRLAGFEVRDTLQWVHGQGFPKSLDVGKAIDKAAGAQREVVGASVSGKILRANGQNERPYQQGLARITHDITAPATDAARQWDGWGTALKPAWEPVIVCRKPLGEPTVAANVLRYGTGALNIGATRVESGSDYHDLHVTQGVNTARTSWEHRRQPRTFAPSAGRWPANLLLSHAPDCDETHGCSLWCPVRELDAQSGVRKSGARHKTAALYSSNAYGVGRPGGACEASEGGSSRFFPTFRYQAKASRSERNRGCEGLPTVSPEQMTGRKAGSAGLVMEGGKANPYAGPTGAARVNSHPTVKPLALMSWLITLITPAGGVVLDPFAGSGSTLCAAKAGGWRYVGIERELEYVRIAEARLAATERPGSLGSATAMKPTSKPTRRKPAKPPTTPLWEIAR